jgi:hypothetical protein
MFHSLYRPSCPHMRLIQASSTDLEAKEGQPKDDSEEDSDEDEEDSDTFTRSYCLIMFVCASWSVPIQR